MYKGCHFGPVQCARRSDTCTRHKQASSFWWFNPNSGNANKIFTVVSYCVNMNCQRAIANSQFK